MDFDSLFWTTLKFLPHISFILMAIACGHIVTSKFEGNDKLVWVLVCIFVVFFGPILYFIFGTKQRLKE